MLREIIEMIVVVLLLVAWIIMFAMFTFGDWIGDWIVSRKQKKGNDKR